jgi:hypothetical protein
VPFRFVGAAAGLTVPESIIPFGIIPNGITKARRRQGNPFQFGRELSSGDLVDRKEDVAAVVEAMTEGGKLFLVGPRRYGKTSILRAASDKVESRKGIVLRYDAEAFTTLELLAGRIMSDTAAKLTSTVEKAGQAIGEFFKSVRPTATYDGTEQKWSVSLAGSPGRDTGAPLLADVLDGVERAAKKAKKSVALVIDEFQKVITDGGPGAEAQIRAAIQRHERVGYVFAGSDTRLLADMTSDPRRPFYKLGDVRFIGALPRRDFVAFLEESFESGGVKLGVGAVDAMLGLADEVPYNVQLLAHACWDEIVARGESKLTAAKVREIRDSVALRNDPIYSQLWVSLTAPQQKALLALLRETSGPTSSAVTRKYAIAVPTMQKALSALEAKGLVRNEPARGGSQMRLEDPLFGAWIALAIPQP